MTPTIVWVGRTPVRISARQTSVYDRNRFADWYLVFVKIAIAAWLLRPGFEITVGSDGSWASTITSQQWAWALLFLAAVRAAAILINGHWQTGGSALIRFVAAAIGAAFWSQIIYYTLDSGSSPFNLGMIVFASWLLLDIASAARAAFDFARIRVARRRAGSHVAGDT